jgi:hypothetical protein
MVGLESNHLSNTKTSAVNRMILRCKLLLRREIDWEKGDGKIRERAVAT